MSHLSFTERINRTCTKNYPRKIQKSNKRRKELQRVFVTYDMEEEMMKELEKKKKMESSEDFLEHQTYAIQLIS